MSEKYVPIEELRDKLAVSTATIRMWVRKGAIPPGAYIKVGNTYRFCVDSVLEALKNYTLNESMKDYSPSSYEPQVTVSVTTEDNDF
jgi:hypothetical protein